MEIKEKLEKHVLNMFQLGGIGEHRYGIFREEDEVVKGLYEFGDVKFRIKEINGDFYWFNCDVEGKRVFLENKYF